MKTISVISQKGGAGKTTLVINIAGAAEALAWRTVVIDLDPQASAKGWHDHRGHETPIVISAQASRIGNVLTTAREHGASLCIIRNSRSLQPCSPLTAHRPRHHARARRRNPPRSLQAASARKPSLAISIPPSPSNSS